MSFRPQKLLLIRFSSFGDITQALSLPAKLSELVDPQQRNHLSIHWVTRLDFFEMVETHPLVNQVWSFDRKLGFAGLLKLIWQLSKENYTHIYDAHHNLRSTLILRGLQFLSLIKAQSSPLILQKSQKRFLRFLLFRFRINWFEKPFSGQRDLIEPLVDWGLSKKLPLPPQLFLKNSTREKALSRLPKNFSKMYFCVAASSAHELKRWPVKHWIELIQSSTASFVLLGGPEDHFLQEIQSQAPDRVLNLAGQCSLLESAALIEASQALVANDTGLLHIAEQLGKKCFALMGPAPFGFPSRDSTQIFELNLPCRPCSKHGQGPCVNPEYQKCLVDLRPSQVFREMRDSFPNV